MDSGSFLTKQIMIFALSTHWNTQKHSSGEAILEEILGMGFKQVELGYDLTINLAAEMKPLVDSKAIEVCSVHNFCPVPIGAPMGHPELFQLASPVEQNRKSAVLHTGRTIGFAGEMGARAVVVHCGNVEITNITRKLIELCGKGLQFSPRYDALKMKLMMKREKKAGKYLDQLQRSLEELLPLLEGSSIKLGIENLPSWESVPTETELEKIIRKFDSPHIAHWHDIGHGRVRQNLGFISQNLWLERLKPYTCGMHIHDVAPPATDHLMPPEGNIDFATIAKLTNDKIIAVIEPAAGTPPEKVTKGLEIIKQAWNSKGDH